MNATLLIALAMTPAAGPVSFRNDVMPVFTRAGCNTGKCHGAARGQDGFRLSLFGYDPAGDHFRLTREAAGRRVNLARPERSLLLRKAIGDVPHTGGAPLKRGSDAFKTLHRWVAGGAPPLDPTEAVPTALTLSPATALVAPGGRPRLTARAAYSDGTERDVTALAVFLSNDEGVAAVAADGTVTAAARGEASVLARFAEFTVAARVIVRPDDDDFRFPDVPEFNYIDRHVHNKLRQLHVTPSQVCTDEEFARRAYLDLTGLPPTPAERQAFLDDRSPKKRERLVDRLLDDPGFARLWTMKWAEVLQIRTTNGISGKGLRLYHDWLRRRVAANAPADAVVREVLSAAGGTFRVPAATYFQSETAPTLLAENVAQAFLGVRIQCAQCHNHPFDRWTMDDYYGFAAFFARVGYKQAQDPRELTVYNKQVGEVRHPTDGRAVAPRFLGGGPEAGGGGGERERLARRLTSPANPLFARNWANRVWAHFVGRGVVEPVDDVRVSNPPSNPELLDALAAKLVAYRFDLKRLARDVCTSRTYQLSIRPNRTNAGGGANFARATVRRLRAEVLLDCINQVTGTAGEGLAVEAIDGADASYFLRTFGRPTRETPCACEVKRGANLSQVLHLINGDTVSRKVAEGGVVAGLLDAGKSPRGVIESLYLRALSRKPTPAESGRLVAVVAAAADEREALEDVFWGILNSKEFLFQH